MFYNPFEGEGISSKIYKAATNKKDVESFEKRDIETLIGKTKNKNKESVHLCVSSNKGGTGKTNIAFQLACNLVARGYKVLLCDLDPQANITCSLLEDENETQAPFSLYDALTGRVELSDLIHEVRTGFEVMGSNFNLSKLDRYLNENYGSEQEAYLKTLESDSTNRKLYKDLYDVFRKLGESYDYVIYETNPEANLLNRISLQACDYVIHPIQPKEASLKSFSIILNELNDAFITIGRADDPNKRIFALWNEANPVPEKKRQKNIDAMRNELGDKLLENIIIYSWEMGQSTDVGYPMFLNPETEFEAIEKFGLAVDEIIERTNPKRREANLKPKRRLSSFI